MYTYTYASIYYIFIIDNCGLYKKKNYTLETTPTSHSVIPVFYLVRTARIYNNFSKAEL